MGNHAAGLGMGIAAQEAVRNRRHEDKAIDILDRICRPFTGIDAEFESRDNDRPGQVHPEFNDYRHPNKHAALGMLMIEAFAPGGLSDYVKYKAMFNEDEEAESAGDEWYDDVVLPFNKRYSFC